VQRPALHGMVVLSLCCLCAAAAPAQEPENANRTVIAFDAPGPRCRGLRASCRRHHNRFRNSLLKRDRGYHRHEHQRSRGGRRYYQIFESLVFLFQSFVRGADAPSSTLRVQGPATPKEPMLWAATRPER